MRLSRVRENGDKKVAFQVLFSIFGAKVVPFPTSLLKVISLPRASTIRLQTANPIVLDLSWILEDVG